MRSLRIAFAFTFAVLLGAAGVTFTANAAHAQDTYRYWAYFTVQDGAFVAAQTGPADANPADGSIEGYRFAAPEDFTQPNVPRADLETVTFDAVCADATAADDQKQVAVLIDYGVAQDAADGVTPPDPQAVCAVVPADANGLQVLEAAADKIRTESGGFGPQLCGINNYPTTGCADEIAQTGTPADETVEFVIGDDQQAAGSADSDAEAAAESDDGTLPLLIGAGVVVVLIAAAGVYLSRRRQA